LIGTKIGDHYSDLEWPNFRHYALFHTRQHLSEPTFTEAVEPTVSNKIVAEQSLHVVFGNNDNG